MCVWFAPLIMMGVSAAASAYSAYQGANAQNKQADYNSQVAQNNADISRQEGAYAQAQAARNAASKRQETEQLIGKQRAKQGASGVVVGSGTALDVVADTAAMGERDAMALLQQGDVEAWRAENKARSYDAQKSQSLSSKVDPTNAVVGSLMSSGAKMGESYFNLKGYAGSAPSTSSGSDSYYDPALQQTVSGVKPPSFH